jgi:HEAT repeat protein
MTDRSGAFAELDDYLAGPFSIDYWSDDAVGHAQTLVAGLSDDGWDALELAWRARPAEWQARAAQSLSHGPPSRAVPVLVRMVGAEDDDVAEAAADALRDFGSPEAPLEVPADLIMRLDRLARARPGPVATVMADLRRRVRATPAPAGS